MDNNNAEKIELLQHAAALLDAEALAVREGHTLDHTNPDWSGEAEAKVAHDDMRNTSTQLRAMATELSQPAQSAVVSDANAWDIYTRATEKTMNTGGKEFAIALTKEIIRLAASPVLTQLSEQEQADFEAWAKRHGGIVLTPVGEKGEANHRLFPATYFYEDAEIAWRAWANKPAALSASQQASELDKEDAEIWRWLKPKFAGYDFYWNGRPDAETEEEKGSVVVVFEVEKTFKGTADIEASIIAARAAQEKA